MYNYQFLDYLAIKKCFQKVEADADGGEEKRHPEADLSGNGHIAFRLKEGLKRDDHEYDAEREEILVHTEH